MSSLRDWLDTGSAADADWGAHVRRLAARGELGFGGGDLLLDLPALAQPHACRPASCAPRLRAAGCRSCCADLDVELSAAEHAAITAALPSLRTELADRDPRWADALEWSDGAVLARPEGRCVFAAPAPPGFGCALHAAEDRRGLPRGALKPMPCRLFPLVVVDLGEPTLLLTALHRSTGRHLGLPARPFPCLSGDDTVRLADSAHDTLAELWGARTAGRIRRAVRRYVRGSGADAGTGA